MKKLLMLAAFSLAAFNLKAQTEAGKYMLGGNISFSSQEQDKNYKNIYYSIVPSAGYFIADNLAIGTGIGYSYSRTTSMVYEFDLIYNTIIKDQAFVFNPFLRKYGRIAEQFKYFGQLSLPMSFGNTKAKETSNNSSYHNVSKYHNLGATLAPGLAFFPSKNFGIEFSVEGIGYHYKKTAPEVGPSVSSNDFSISTDLFTPIIGIQFYF
jgi:hypothetical protein